MAEIEHQPKIDLESMSPEQRRVLLDELNKKESGVPAKSKEAKSVVDLEEIKATAENLQTNSFTDQNIQTEKIEETPASSLSSDDELLRHVNETNLIDPKINLQAFVESLNNSAGAGSQDTAHKI